MNDLKMKINMPLGDRMKEYEKCSSGYIIPHMPTIIRIDGKNFHTFTRKIGAKKPFDVDLRNAFFRTAVELISYMQNAVLLYHQSDEISILLKDWPDLNTEQWFSGNIQKIASISASATTAIFNHEMKAYPRYAMFAMFDARVFQLPLGEVTNYFIWRQKDWERNSIQMLARSHYSHSQLNKKSIPDIHNMLHAVGVNWNKCDIWKKRGTLIKKTPNNTPVVGLLCPDETPIFSEEREHIESCLV